jgi:hypothetical protein
MKNPFSARPLNKVRMQGGARGVLGSYAAAPRERAGYPPEDGCRRWAFFSGLLANFEAVRTTPQEERRAAAIQHITEIAEIPSEQEAWALESIEAQPSVTREVLMRRIA